MRTLALLSDDDRRFLHDFEKAALDPESFHHGDHLRAAWATLGSYPLLEAMARYVAAIKRLATRAGSPGIYHETITLAYLLLIHERLSRQEAAEDFAAFMTRHADLFTWRPSILDSYYDSALLSSEMSRKNFVLPVRPSDTGSP